MALRPDSGNRTRTHSPHRRRLLLVALLTTGAWSGCASRIESPRDPYMLAGPETIVGDAPDARRDAFEVLDQWNWSDTLDAGSPSPFARPALAKGKLGLHAARRFRLADSRCGDCPTPAAALWHFPYEVLAVPTTGSAVIDAQLEEYAQPALLPSLVWLGSPEVVDRASIGPDGLTVSVGDEVRPLALPPRNPLDRSDLDASTAAFFSQREVRLRGASHVDDGREAFVARTIWPQDSGIRRESLTLAPLAKGELLTRLVDAQIVGETSAFPARLLFERGSVANAGWAGKPTIALVLSGAQGDDDGAGAGHLGVATGFFGPDGEWSDWLVENFYPHRVASVKGIVSASVPMDNYLLDVNSGQLFFRPAYMLVAVLRRPDAAHEIQGALQRTMLDHYCRRIEYDAATRNSTAMSIDPLRQLGWRIPAAGPTSRFAGVLGAPVAAGSQASLSAGRDFMRGMATETTRLLPRVAFEVAGHDLLYLVQARPPAAELTRFEQRLVDDVEAVVFVRLPQVPSTRRNGTYPVRSLLQYGARVRSDPSERQAAPSGEYRALPDELKRDCDIRPIGVAPSG
jgi:hypothetical protein